MAAVPAPAAPATPAAPITTVEPPSAAAAVEGDSDSDDAPKAAPGKKKKKKPKKKKKANAGGVPVETVPTLSETAEETAAWEAQLVRGAKTFSLPRWVLNERVSAKGSGLVGRPRIRWRSWMAAAPIEEGAHR